MPQVKYNMISQQLEQSILSGSLSGRLPGMHLLAKSLGINHVTLGKAIRQLERKGLLVVDGTRGTFVCDSWKAAQGIRAVAVLCAYWEPVSVQCLSDTLNSQYALQGIRFHFLNMANISLDNGEMLLKMDFAGYIFLGGSGNVDLLRFLHQNGRAIVGGLQENLPWLSGVDYDHYDMACQAFRHLKSYGHRRIAFLEFNRPPDFQFYLSKFRQAGQDVLGSDYDPALFLTDGDPLEYYRKYGENYCHAYLAEKIAFFLALPRPPTALLTIDLRANSPHACQNSLGVKVPEELSLVITTDRQGLPDEFLTRVVADLQARFDWSVRKIIRLLENNSEPVEKHRIKGALRAGHSVAVPKIIRLLENNSEPVEKHRIKGALRAGHSVAVPRA